MNRSILIVICDFLLVTLLAFSNVDVKHLSQNNSGPGMKLELSTNSTQAEGSNDMAAVMKLALEDERKQRTNLIGELRQARQTAGERDTQTRNLQQQLETRDQEAARLQQAQGLLERQIATAQTNIQTLNQQLQNTSSEASTTKEKLSLAEAQAQKESEQATALQQKLAELTRSNQTVLSERQRLASQLQVAEVEKRAASEQAARMQEEVKIEREEKAKLAEGVKALASRSGELAQEVRDNRPLAPNLIFSEFLSNRVEADVRAFRSGFWGMDTDKQKQTGTVLVTDGTNIFALCHVQDTPISISSPGTEWERLTGTLGHRTAAMFLPIRAMSFSSTDPRVVLIPVTQTEAKQLGGKVYRTSTDPYKFQDAVLVGAQDAYYGECKFQIDPTTPDYVKLDRNLLKGLFGKFNPSRGDIVFSKTDEILGIMVNDSYCMMIRHLDPGATMQFGQDVRGEHTGETLSKLYASLASLPIKLQ